MVTQFAGNFHVQIFAKEAKDIPEWMRAHHAWEAALDVKKLPV